MKLIAASILVVGVVIAVVGWRLTERHPQTCGGGLGPAMACSPGFTYGLHPSK